MLPVSNSGPRTSTNSSITEAWRTFAESPDRGDFSSLVSSSFVLLSPASIGHLRLPDIVAMELGQVAYAYPRPLCSIFRIDVGTDLVVLLC
jgi:hypothetical protein